MPRVRTTFQAMKRRIIINIDHDGLTDEQAVALVGQVIDGGRVSESRGFKHYCHISTTKGGTAIHAYKRSSTTDAFNIWKRE